MIELQNLKQALINYKNANADMQLQIKINRAKIKQVEKLITFMETELQKDIEDND